MTLTEFELQELETDQVLSGPLADPRIIALLSTVRDLQSKLATAEGLVAFQQEQIGGWQRKAGELKDALIWVLPMAKGYAHANRVGRNAEIIANAEAVINTETTG